MGCSNVKEEDVIAVNSSSNQQNFSKAKNMNDSDDDSKLAI